MPYFLHTHWYKIQSNTKHLDESRINFTHIHTHAQPTTAGDVWQTSHGSARQRLFVAMGVSKMKYNTRECVSVCEGLCCLWQFSLRRCSRRNRWHSKVDFNNMVKLCNLFVKCAECELYKGWAQHARRWSVWNVCTWSGKTDSIVLNPFWNE